jgi:hypothetical protein
MRDVTEGQGHIALLWSGMKNLGGAGALLMRELAGAVLPSTFERREWGLFCVYVMGGKNHDAMVDQMQRQHPKMELLPKQTGTLSRPSPTETRPQP